MRVTSIESTVLFAGARSRPRQLVRVGLSGSGSLGGGAVEVAVHGPGVSTPEPAALACPGAGEQATVEVGVEIAAPADRGTTRPVTAVASTPSARAELAGQITVAEPGWTMWMVSHFHYDPVWWTTQGQFLQTRLLLPGADGQRPEVRTAFELVRLHLDAARCDPDYKFVLAELDYLKPYFDACPQDRADLLELIRAGRIELVGGMYNEPNTNLTCAESTIRNAVYGLGYQADVLGARPRVSWMLDAFGFDPGYPGLIAEAGLSESAWARGPFHQWGPRATVGDNRRMQFPAEFEWVSPSGSGLLTGYLANHYSAGWATQRADSLADAEAAAYEQFCQLAPVAATRNVLLPVGGDHVIPSKWATAIHRDWNARYVWPRFVTAVPSEFFAAVRAEAERRDVWIMPQTRDMNPVYPGKDVTYIDTKQAQRAAEVAVCQGERLSTLAWLAGADYPVESLDRAWRLLAFGAHHDAITGTEGDQVYLDLLAGWREAFDRGDAARLDAARYLARTVNTAALPRAVAGTVIVVLSALAHERSGMVSVELPRHADRAGPVELRDDSGAAVPVLAEADTLTFRATDVPALGHRCYVAVPAEAAPADGWRPLSSLVIENERFRVAADPDRGGCLTGIYDKVLGRELLSGPGNELVLQEEYPAHPRWGEGPWLLCPKGPGARSTAVPAQVRAERSPVGSRLVSVFHLGGLSVTQETVLADGADRIEFRTHVDSSIGQDRLLRVAFPARVPGGLPVYSSAVSVLGRPPGSPDSDVAEHWFTLDSPAHEWFGIGSTARVALAGHAQQAIGVAEVVTPSRQGVRDLLAALAACGVTATCSLPAGSRYGAIDADSNLPDFRIALGGPEVNQFTAAVLAGTAVAAQALHAQLTEVGTARVWVPAAKSRAEQFAPGADLRGAADLPVLIVAAHDLPAAVAQLTADLADAVIEVPAGPFAPADPVADYSVALLNRGTPSGLVTPDGTLTMALMRSCGSWPAGVWIDGERRAAPDGSSFALQHWSHTFEYALTAGPGDWRSAGFARAGQEYGDGLLAVTSDAHSGPSPARASLGGIEPVPGPDDEPVTGPDHEPVTGPDHEPIPVALSALKPFGNPHARLSTDPPARENGITVRLAGQTGLPAPIHARVRVFTGLAQARRCDPCEREVGEPLPVSGGTVTVPVPGAGLVTFTAMPDAATLTATAHATTPTATPHTATPTATPHTATLTATPHTATPTATPYTAVRFARYWLHGTGPAPPGNLPVAVHLHPGQPRGAADPPSRLALRVPPLITTGRASAPVDGETGRVRVTVACGPEPASGQVDLGSPPGLTVDPAGPLRYDLPAFGHAEWVIEVRVGPEAAHGRRYLTARTADVEDAILLTVGEPDIPALDVPLDEQLPLRAADEAAGFAEVELTLAAHALRLAPGQRGEIDAVLTNRLAGPVRAHAELICPYGTWDFTRDHARAVELGPSQRSRLTFPIIAPAAARTGQQWWALVKVMYFGRLRYSDSVLITIG